MATKLRRRTEVLRRTVTQDGRIILGPDELDEGDRDVQIIIPASPKVYIAVGPQPESPRPEGLEGIDNAGALPEDVSYQRTYQWVPLDGDQTVTLSVQAGQWISAMADEGQITLAVFVEYPA